MVLPGGILMGLGLKSYYYMEEARLAPLKMKKYFLGAGITLFLYGILDGLFGPRAEFFPANILNAESFLISVKVPVETFRSLCAVTATWSLVGMIKIFNWEIGVKLQKAQDILRRQLRESEARYMEIVEASSDIIHSIDENNIIVSSNSRGCALLDYKMEDLIGKSIKVICSDATWTALQKELLKARIEGSALMDHGHLIKKTGEKIDVVVHAIAMFDNSKNFLGMRLTFRDITERRKIEEAFLKSEERYRLLFEESRDAIYMTNREGFLIDINQSGLDLFGYEKEVILGLNPVQLFANPSDHATFMEAISSGKFVRDYAVQLRKISGKIMECLVTASLRMSSDGRLLGSQGIIRDVTQRNKMEEELLKIEKLESVGLMAGGIAHDFNNILTTIAANISVAHKSSQDSKYISDILSEASKACKHAKNLTSQLLVFSKGGDPIKEITDMRALLREAAGFALRGSNINFVDHINDDLWSAEVDRGQMVQVIHNLVLNAQQAMQDSGTIEVHSENIHRHNKSGAPSGDIPYIKISVVDNGVGIPKEHLKKIFDPFFTTKDDGSGLGLTCSYSIIKNHGGHLSVHSIIETGTTFEIFLPAADRSPDEQQNNEAAPVSGSGRILVMDDEESVRTSVRKMLVYMGYDVSLAENGEAALKTYKRAMEDERPFNAVIMDLTIKGGTGGKETIEELRRIDPGVVGIVSSGYFNDPIMADYKKYGFAGVIPKPYEMDDLGQLLQSLMTNTGISG